MRKGDSLFLITLQILVVLLIVVLVFSFSYSITGNVISRSQHAFCQGESRDQAYLYNTITSITESSTGFKTFSVLRADGTLLRKATIGEKLFARAPPGLSVSYDIMPTCGGVDIVYLVTNPTADEKSLGALTFQIPGVMISSSSEVLGIEFSQGLTELKESRDLGTYGINAYSPVIVTRDSDFSAGSALLYPYLAYGAQSVRMNVFFNGSDGWTYSYGSFKQRSLDEEYTGAIIPPDTTRSYIVSLRFAEPRHYILTLDPYKKFFTSAYESDNDRSDKDRRPIRMIPLSGFSNVNDDNPRGYIADTHDPHINGWSEFISSFLDETMLYGFERVMLRAPSGSYPGNPEVCHPVSRPDDDCNLPSKFMDFIDEAHATRLLFRSFNDAGVQLGFWWGRASQTPSPNIWEPSSVPSEGPITLMDASYSKPARMNFLRGQLAKAANLHTTLIGLDAFTRLFPSEKIQWIAEMKDTYGIVKLIHEPVREDIIHAYTDFYVWVGPSRSVKDIEGPDVLAAYLNPGADLVIPLGDNAYPSTSGNALKLVRWGYTPWIQYKSGADGPIALFDPATIPIVQCYDGIDNDGDGVSDFPYDPECRNAADDGEGIW